MISQIKEAQALVHSQILQKIEDIGPFQAITKRSAKELSSLILDMGNVNGLFEEVDRLERKIARFKRTAQQKEICVTVTCPNCGNRKWVEGAIHKIFRVKPFCTNCGQHDRLMAEDNNSGRMPVPLADFQRNLDDLC